MAPTKLELFYDVVSPYSYLAAVVLERYTRTPSPLWPLELVWRPAFLAGVFKAVGNTPPASLPQRASYLLQDIARLSRFFDVDMTVPETFPGDTLRAMRLLSAAALTQPARVGALSMALWRRHWGKGREVASDDALLWATREAGLDDGAAVVARTSDAEVKDALRRATDEAVARGAFGFPATFVALDGEDALFFGSDRLELLAHTLGLPWRGPRPSTTAGAAT
ncbi:MAG: DsbA family protein [Deltaproteobacteria bacterium]|nr:DsbA family protein [Deltaproteobacteria bacterium]